MELLIQKLLNQTLEQALKVVPVEKSHWLHKELIFTLLNKQTQIQTLILSKEKFKTRADAKKWVVDHDFKSTKIDETSTSFRFRQKEPSDFIEGSFRTITITDGVSAVIGRPKKKS